MSEEDKKPSYVLQNAEMEYLSAHHEGKWLPDPKKALRFFHHENEKAFKLAEIAGYERTLYFKFFPEWAMK